MDNNNYFNKKNRCYIIAEIGVNHNGDMDLAKQMIDVAESKAIELGSSLVHIDIRETQKVAIKLFELKGYKKWGTNPFYANVDGKNLKGYYFYVF